MTMNFSKVFGAGLLTLAVLGGTAAYLGSTLSAKSAPVTAYSYTIEQPDQTQRHAEVIVTEGQAS